MNRSRVMLFLVPVLTLAVCSGCLKRTLSVRSDPPGALVYIDGLEVGRTPLANLPFHFYGTREIALYSDGHLTERRAVEIDSPWYASFPLDIFSELIIPWDIRDRRFVFFQLKRDEPVERLTLMRHAHETRGVALNRIDGARRASDFRPRAHVVAHEPKRFFLWGPFLAPPRTDPTFKKPLPPPDLKPEAQK
jgi:PEGA domain-containing protein